MVKKFFAATFAAFLLSTWMAIPATGAARIRVEQLAPSAARTASWDSRIIGTPIGAIGVIVVIHATAGSGFSVDNQIQIHIKGTDTWSDYMAACGSPITSTGAQVCTYTIRGAQGAQHSYTIRTGPIPAEWRLQFIHGNGNSVTYTAELHWLY